METPWHLTLHKLDVVWEPVHSAMVGFLIAWLLNVSDAVTNFCQLNVTEALYEISADKMCLFFFTEEQNPLPASVSTCKLYTVNCILKQLVTV